MTSRILIQGEEFNIIFSKKKFIKPNVLMIGDELHIFTAENNIKPHQQVLLEWLKKQSKLNITKRTREIALLNNFEFNRIAIKDQSTRWGSCSSYKNLNFNWRLYLAPISISDYVIVHELAHTKEMNHSKDFWSIVESIIPEYKLHRRWLRDNERALKLMI